MISRDEMISLAEKVIGLEENNLIVRCPFFGAAVGKLRLAVMSEASTENNSHNMALATDGATLFYNPSLVINLYKNEGVLLREYLHMLMHLIFMHNLRTKKVVREYWDIASDITAEAVILGIGNEIPKLDNDILKNELISALRNDVGSINVDMVYSHILKIFKEDISDEKKNRIRQLEELCRTDDHDKWWDSDSENSNDTSKKQLEEKLKAKWKKIGERALTEYKIVKKKQAFQSDIYINLSEAVEDRIDYDDFLRRFMQVRENIIINDDEFDYIYYKLGLDTYGNMPLIEPLEYGDDKKINEFVIVLDTSASCQGDKLNAFIRHTFDMLSDDERFYEHTVIHIIQSDDSVKNDFVVRTKDDVQRFINDGKIYGYGGTDFRPAIKYVEGLVKAKKLNNLKGVIYFTDGIGIYPDYMPPFEVAFVFVKNGTYEEAIKVPVWASRVFIDMERVMYEY